MADNERWDWTSVAEWDWVQLQNRLTLHHMAAMDDLESAELEWGGDGVTTCGLRGYLMIPGLFSRTGCRRCTKCCDALGWPRGTGSPKNDSALRPLADARLAGRTA